MHRFSALIIPLVLGTLLPFIGAYLMGWLAVFALEHKYFGLPVETAVAVEDMLVWVPLSLLIGAIIGFQSQVKILAKSLAVVVIAIIVLAATGFALWRQHDLSPDQQFQVLLLLFRSPGLIFLFFVPLGAYVAARFRRA